MHLNPAIENNKKTKMIPSLNALKTGLQYILLDRVDIHTSISVLQIVEPDNPIIEELKGAEHDLWQVAEMLSDRIKEREECDEKSEK
jgi:hypothetical protein